MAVQSLSETMPNGGIPNFYDTDFRNVLEDHIPMLISSAGARYYPLDPSEAYYHRGDFYALMKEVAALPEQYHWIVMRCNGLTNPLEYDGKVLQLLLPDLSEVDRIWDMFRTSRRN